MPIKKITLPQGTKVPNHIAVILDGNRRWARARGLKTLEGHKAGFDASRRISKAAREFGVHTFTVWGFSTENWDRSPMEIAYLMKLFHKFFDEARKEAAESDTRIIHLGRKDRLPKGLIKKISAIEEETRNNSSHVLNVALDYGGQDEILRAVKNIIKDQVPAKNLNEKLFSSYLDTGDQPHPYPDLFIRPSGEQRTSGLMPWQMVYAEYFWEKDNLPDMTAGKLKEAILDYSRRRRRFGGEDIEEHFSFKPEIAANLEVNWWRLANIPEGTRFRDYAMQHIREQWGLSTKLATQASKHLIKATLMGKNQDWKKASRAMHKFYKLIKEEVELAFEPRLVASLDMKLWQPESESLGDLENDTRQLVSEVYRISELQASKAAHLRSLATLERRKAERGEGEIHWARAEEYLVSYYKALKDRVA